MTLDEAIVRYHDDTKMRRKSYGSEFKHVVPEIVEAYKNSGAGVYDIRWLKGLKAWANQESVNMGFMIPINMMNDAKADDWEVV